MMAEYTTGGVFIRNHGHHTNIDDVVKLLNYHTKLLDATKGLLSMSDMRHPHGGCTLGQTGHFQEVAKWVKLCEAVTP